MTDSDSSLKIAETSPGFGFHRLGTEVHFTLGSVDATVNRLSTPMSNLQQKKTTRFIVVSNLAALLKERRLSQEKLAAITGIAKENISRLKNRKVVLRIDCAAAVRICDALSNISIVGQGHKSSIDLGALFPIKRIDR